MSSTFPAAPQVISGRGPRVLAVTGIGVAMSALDTTIVNVARDTLAREFGSSGADVSWVWSGYAIVFAAVLLTAGRLADRYGRRRVYLTGLAIFVGASALCASAPGLSWLIAARGVQAIGGALLTPAALALVLPEYPFEKRSTAIGVWGAIGSVAAAVGPVAGSLLITVASWRAAFLVNVPVGAVGLWLGRRVLHETRDEHAAGVPDPASVVSGILAVGLLVLAISKGNSWGYSSLTALVLVGAAAALLVIFMARSRVARLPVLDLHLLRIRAFTVANGSTLLFAIPFYGSVFANVSFLQEVWHYSVLRAGVAWCPGPCTAMLTARPAGRLCDRYGSKVVVVPAALLIATAVFGLALTTTSTPHYVTSFLPFVMMIGAAIGALITGLQSAAVKFVPANRFAMASAFYATLRQVGAALAVAIAVAAITRPGSAIGNFHLAWLIQGVGGVGVAVVMGALYRSPAQ